MGEIIYTRKVRGAYDKPYITLCNREIRLSHILIKMVGVLPMCTLAFDNETKLLRLRLLDEDDKNPDALSICHASNFSKTMACTIHVTGYRQLFGIEVAESHRVPVQYSRASRTIVADLAPLFSGFNRRSAVADCCDCGGPIYNLPEMAVGAGQRARCRDCGSGAPLLESAHGKGQELLEDR